MLNLGTHSLIIFSGLDKDNSGASHVQYFTTQKKTNTLLFQRLRDKDGKARRTFRTDVHCYLPLQNILDDKQIYWKRHGNNCLSHPLDIFCVNKRFFSLADKTVQLTCTFNVCSIHLSNLSAFDINIKTT